MGREERGFAVLRILFGVVWGIDAYLKWQPTFMLNFMNYLLQAAQGQPPLIHAWIELWIGVVSVNPFAFAIVVALAETAIAVGLLVGLFTRTAIWGGFALVLLIWSTAEGFGGPYLPGVTDIGPGPIYALLFLALWMGKCWQRYSVDLLLRRLR